MDEAEQVAVDIADVKRHLGGAPREPDAAVGIAEQQQRVAGGVGGVGRLQECAQHVDRPQRALSAVGGGVVAAVHVGRAAGEAATAQLVVFESVEVGVHTTRGRAFAQVDEGFHGRLPEIGLNK